MSPHPPAPPTASSRSPAIPARLDAFHFDRLGVRVPAILVSPWVQKGAVINDVFEHASIPATVTDFFLGAYDARSPREKVANTFLDRLTLDTMRSEDDCPSFELE